MDDQDDGGQKINARNTIKKILTDTHFIEYPEDLPNRTNSEASQCRVRFINMTSSEYESIKDFTLTIFIGGINEAVFCEGFCYNVMDLCRNGYLELDGSNMYIPIPLSKKRWDFINGKYARLRELTNDTPGMFMYPLLKSEVVTILSSIHEQPVVCSMSSGCAKVTPSECDSKKISYSFDESPDKRYGPMGVKFLRKRPDPVLNADGKESTDMDSRVAQVKEMVVRELSGIYDTELIKREIESREIENKIATYLSSELGRNESQVAGMIINEFLSERLRSVR